MKPLAILPVLYIPLYVPYSILSLIPPELKGPSEGLNSHQGRETDEPIVETANFLEQGAKNANEALPQDQSDESAMLRAGSADEALDAELTPIQASSRTSPASANAVGRPEREKRIPYQTGPKRKREAPLAKTSIDEPPVKRKRGRGRPPKSRFRVDAPPLVPVLHGQQDVLLAGAQGSTVRVATGAGVKSVKLA
ncbi:hypothetical protein HWV62_38751 [Athelia sp. TMB]|nr:hypothetical protein HWV62_38751 [Athelia sp. TMB]